jgi:hypothetical protein
MYTDFKKGDKVVYIKTGEDVEIIEVHRDDLPNLYYTIKTEENKEIQTDQNNLMDITDFNTFESLKEDIELFITIDGYNRPGDIKYLYEDIKDIYGEDIVKEYKKVLRNIIYNKLEEEDSELEEEDDETERLKNKIVFLEDKISLIKSRYITTRKEIIDEKDERLEDYISIKEYEKILKTITDSDEPIKLKNKIVLKESMFNDLQEKSKKYNDIINSNLISKDSKEYLVLKEFFKNSMAHNHMGTENLSTEEKFHPSIMEKYYNAYVRK